MFTVSRRSPNAALSGNRLTSDVSDISMHKSNGRTVKKKYFDVFGVLPIVTQKL
jgi:hypothetical protein